MKTLFASWMFLLFAPTRRHVMDELIVFSGRAERHALQVLQPGFPHDVPPPVAPHKTVPDAPVDVPVPDPKDIPPYEPEDVPPPHPGKTPPPKPARPKSSGPFR